MKHKVVFQYNEHGRFPENRAQDEPIVLEEGESVLMPAVGDAVTYEFDGRATTFKVLNRHFTYLEQLCTVHIEVGQPRAPKPLGLKE